MMSENKRKIIGRTMLITGLSVCALGTYDSLSEKYNNETGKQAVERCVDDGAKCSLEEYKVASEYLTHQNKSMKKELAGFALSVFGISISSTSSRSRRKVKPSKKPPTPPKS